MQAILIANRGEIAVRLARAATDLGLHCVAVYSSDDASSLHIRVADEARLLPGSGAAAYLDIDALLRAAQDSGCDAVHPGYGFLSENAEFARRCEAAGLLFIGPSADHLELFGDKSRACAYARDLSVPVIPGTAGAATLEQVRDFFGSPAGGGAIMIKALAGGGGRGMRAVTDAALLNAAYERCSAEALSSFGRADVYAERLLTHARHIEVQVIGDGTGACVHVGERECSLQRSRQKLFEIAPSPSLSPALRQALTEAAVRMASAVSYRGLGTFEFLVDLQPAHGTPGYAFIEANPRLQVEHTVTEMVSGLDLVQLQMQIAAGATLASLGLNQTRAAQRTGRAVQLRINMEVMAADGSARPASGTLSAFSPPGGPGVRVDTFGYTGYTSNARFDSLLAKLIVHHPSDDYLALLRKAERALSEFRIEGVQTNKTLFFGLLGDPRVQANEVDTAYVEAQLPALLARGEAVRRERYVTPDSAAGDAAVHAAQRDRGVELALPEGSVAVTAPLQGTVISIDVSAGSVVRAGQQLAVLEAMKMQHVVHAEQGGIVRRLVAEPGETLAEGAALVIIDIDLEPAQRAAADESAADLDTLRPALAEVLERHRWTLDERRPKAIEKRRVRGQRTARENVDDLLDAGSTIEYAPLGIAQQRSTRTLDDLVRNTPADGIVIQVGSVNGAHFAPEQARCMAMAYDYTVLAGTQGRVSHDKTDRAIKVAEQWRIPVVLFAEGGGGRAGEVDAQAVPKLQTSTFAHFARLSGLVPRVGIVSGYSFAGNAALLGCCDIIIATRNASFGMGGPAMIEGGGLGACRPEEVGPVSMQAPNGVIDVLVEDEAEAVAAAKQYLGYFQGAISDWEAGDQRLLRHLVPENRLRVYEMRKLIHALADSGSVLELRAQFGVGIITAFARIEGRPMGIIANNPKHLGGAIDADAADKAARFMQLCDAFDIPLLSLCDTPGFMVGPAAESTALVRHVSRMFITAANISVPLLAVLVRKAYGLGAQAMTAGGFHEPVFTVAWPSCEIGTMGFEGMVRLGFKKELDAIEDPVARQARYDALIAKEYEKGNALHAASFAVLDDVIDPLDTRHWITSALRAMPPLARRDGKKRSFVDTW
ncbi:MAG: carboxyl transferase domain-containing protein [Janthinobacterium lividum]